MSRAVMKSRLWVTGFVVVLSGFAVGGGLVLAATTGRPDVRRVWANFVLRTTEIQDPGCVGGGGAQYTRDENWLVGQETSSRASLTGRLKVFLRTITEVHSHVFGVGEV